MRWKLMKKAWEMAHEAFPGLANLYVETPRHLGCQGRCTVLDLGKKDPIGHVLYQVVSVDRKPVLRVELAGNSRSLSMPMVSQAFEVQTKIEKFASPPKIDPVLMAKNCSDGFELGQKVALLVADELKGKSALRKEVVAWLDRNDFPAEMITPTLEGLRGLGYEASDNSFNLRTAKPENKFEAYQMVRIIQPSSMEHQECGKILEAKGGGKDPEWYLVRVDGSEKPIWFPASSLAPDEAGRVQKT